MASPNPDTILQAALELSEEQRIALVTRLVESLPETAASSFDDAEFQRELERRFADSADTIPWSQVRDEL